MSVLFIGASLLMQPATAYADPAPVDLGSAADFGVLAGTSVDNINVTIVNSLEEGFAHVGVSPGSTVTGFPPGIVEPPSTVHGADGLAAEAQADLAIAYTDAASRPCDQNVTGQNLSGQTLTAGVYCFAGSAHLDGPDTLILDGEGNPDAQFIFQVGSNLTTTSEFWMFTDNGAQDLNVTWQVGGSVNLGFTSINGVVMAQGDITATFGSVVWGRVLARDGAISLDANFILPIPLVPEVGVPQAPLLGSAGSALAVVGFVIGTAVLVMRRRTQLAQV